MKSGIDMLEQSYEYGIEKPIAGSIFIERRFNVQRVPTVAEVNDFFRLLRFGTKWHAFFSLCFFCGLRPIEVCSITTDMIKTDGKRWVGLCYPVGKAKPTGKKGVKATRKWNNIDERMGDIPIGALSSLQHYWTTERQDFGLLFPKCYTGYRTVFMKMRRSMIALGHDSWGRTSEEYYSSLWGLKGKVNEYDITAYSGRRWFVSMYHWLLTPTNGVPDLVQTQRRMAHTGAKDTAIYVHNWRAIGLLPDQIGGGWKVMSGHNPTQSRLNQWW